MASNIPVRNVDYDATKYVEDQIPVCSSRGSVQRLSTASHLTIASDATSSNINLLSIIEKRALNTLSPTCDRADALSSTLMDEESI